MNPIPVIEQTIDAILLNSGGIDSRVVACLAQNAGYRLHSFFVDSNEKIRDVARPAAQKTADLYCSDHFVFPYPVDWCIERGGGKFGTTYPLLMSHTLGAQYALFNGIGVIFSGQKSEGTPDDFITPMNWQLSHALQHKKVVAYAPLYNRAFAEVVELAKQFSVPLEDTYSCGKVPACGKCFTCKKRASVGL